MGCTLVVLISGVADAIDMPGQHQSIWVIFIFRLSSLASQGDCESFGTEFSFGGPKLNLN